MATIKVLQNGPYLVQGDDITAVDWNGETYAISKRPFALCRCGGSTTKPFCDGTTLELGSRRLKQRCQAAKTNPPLNPKHALLHRVSNAADSRPTHNCQRMAECGLLTGT